MTPVKQTDLRDFHGNCLAACVASILEIPLEQVPNFRLDADKRDMFETLGDWLRNEHGKTIVGLRFYRGDGPMEENTVDKILNCAFVNGVQHHVILSGESPRKTTSGGKKYHSVIGKSNGWGFEIIHDPHPEGTGLIGEPYSVHWIL